MAILGYARVSTIDQNLTAQVEQLEAAGCERIYQEKVSGVKRDRPELSALLDFVREGDVVVACKVDRIARSTSHLLEIVETFNRKGVAFKILNINLDTTTANGKLMLTMLAAIGEFEREMMLERQREGIQVAKAEGRYKGRKPTAREKAGEVLRLLGEGVSKAEVARRLGIGIASVYRVTGKVKS
jgi:DNA invertase Pin-like site-specific DNA recombinase